MPTDDEILAGLVAGETSQKPATVNHPIDEFPPATTISDVASGTTPTEAGQGSEVTEAVEETAEDILKKIHVILAEHNNRESDIGLKHEYWGLVNKYRHMLRK